MLEFELRADMTGVVLGTKVVERLISEHMQRASFKGAAIRKRPANSGFEKGTDLEMFVGSR